MTRKICYVSGTRADFGLMRSTLARINADPAMELSILVTGMHLQKAYGHTVDEIVKAGFRLMDRVPVSGLEPSGAIMARNIGLMIGGFVEALERERPEIVLLLGDRGEMLAGAIAACHLNIPIAHVAGGERSGTIDEPVRHAISKLAHVHLVSTEGSRDRLIQMGEREDLVFAFGAPGLDDMLGIDIPGSVETKQHLGLKSTDQFLLFIFHPVLHDAHRAGADCGTILDGLNAYRHPIVALAPNSDAGSSSVLRELQDADGSNRVILKTHLPRELYIAALAHCDLLIGNSSSGIIEAGSFGIPVINVGPRQNLRERNANVIDVDFDVEEIARALSAAVAQKRFPAHNIYGDGRSGERIADLLRNIDLGPHITRKVNCY